MESGCGYVQFFPLDLLFFFYIFVLTHHLTSLHHYILHHYIITSLHHYIITSLHHYFCHEKIIKHYAPVRNLKIKPHGSQVVACSSKLD